jgi:hypothetical protein
MVVDTTNRQDAGARASTVQLVGIQVGAESEADLAVVGHGVAQT